MLRWIIVACLALLSPAAAFAHSGQGPHGGPLADAGPYYVELVVEGAALRIFVFDERNDKPVGTKEAKATATLLVGQDKETVTLEPAAADAGGNSLAGQTAKSVGAGSRVVVLIQFPGKPSIIARFAL